MTRTVGDSISSLRLTRFVDAIFHSSCQKNNNRQSTPEIRPGATCEKFLR
jgi:hypothetical protein